MDTKRITGIILAGGKSSRMGTDKGFLKIENKLFVEIIVDFMKKYFKHVIIIANDDRYTQFGVPVFQDEFENKGPIAGIYTGLKNCITEYAFITTIDAPFISENLLAKLVSQLKGNTKAVVSRFNHRIYPLTAIYARNSQDDFLQSLERNRLKVIFEIEKLNPTFVEFDESFSKEFQNFNTPEDLKSL